MSMQEDDSDRLNTLLNQLLRSPHNRLFIKRCVHTPVHTHALTSFKSRFTWNQRPREFKKKIIQVILVFATHLQRVTEAFGSDEARLNPATLN